MCQPSDETTRSQTMERRVPIYKIVNTEEAPVPKRGQRWNLPLQDIGPGQMMLLDMSPKVAEKNMSAIRSYVSRQQKLLGLRLSVHKTDDGVVIFRRELKEL